jgi:hypothetical protein
MEGLGIGTFSPLLFLGVAAAWRYRDHAFRMGAAVAAVIVCKLFLWPLFLWLLVARRLRAAAWTAGLAGAMLIGSWAAIGFAGLADYQRLLGRLTELVGPNSFSFYALCRGMGVSSGGAQLVAAAFGVALVLALGRRDDAAGLSVAIAASLVATPILWPHYLVLLVVPIALASPAFSLWWCLPSLLWFDAHPWSYGRSGRIAFELGLTLAFCGAAYARSVASTSSAWLSGFTFRMTRLTLPFSSMTKVDRSTPT